MNFVGWDQSLNHAAGVMLDDDGSLRDWWFLTSTAGDINPITRDHGTVFPPAIRGAAKSKARIADQHVHGIARLRFIKQWFVDVMPNLRGEDTFFALEDYAQSAHGLTHQIGEAGGLLRLHLVEYGSLRLPNVNDVKMFATGKGGSGKDAEVRPAVMRDYAGSEFVQLVTQLENRGVDNDVVGDLVDAFVLAQLVRTEVLIRMGRMSLADVPGTVDSGPRRVFLRVTDKRGVNLLDRPFAMDQNTRG